MTPHDFFPRRRRGSRRRGILRSGILRSGALFPDEALPGGTFPGWAAPARCALLLAAGLLAGCDGEALRSDAPVELRDSAGVTIVESSGPGAWEDGGGWRAVEDLELGGDGRPGTDFGHVTDVAVDRDGRIYVLDGFASEVRVFGPDGAFLRSLGGAGEGPGELSRFATDVIVSGDTVLVADGVRGRVTRHSTDGEVLEALRLPPGLGGQSWWSLLPDGAFAVRAVEREVSPEGRWTGRDRLLRLDPSTSEVDTLLVFDYEASDIGGPGSPIAPIFVDAPSWAILPDGRIAWTSLHRPRLRIHDPDGALRRIVAHGAWRAAPLTEAERERLVERLGVKMEMLGSSAAALDGIDVTAPDSLPVLTGVLSGPDSTIWVRRMGGVGRVHPMALNAAAGSPYLGGPSWDVLDAEGRYLGTVTLPPRFTPFLVTDSAVYGVRLDELDVERVTRLRLER